MLSGTLEFFATKKIILGSSSKTRQTLLGKLKIPFVVDPSGADETLEKEGKSGEDYCLATCKLKMDTMLSRYKDKDWDVLITADTIIIQDGKVFEKPVDAEESAAFLRSFSGRDHRAITTMVLAFNRGGEVTTFEDLGGADIRFPQLSERAIKNFAIENPEIMQMSGGYTILGAGSSLFEKVDGDFNSILGLPMAKLCQRFLQFYEKDIDEFYQKK